jgi:hypothetical protein
MSIRGKGSIASIESILKENKLYWSDFSFYSKPLKKFSDWNHFNRRKLSGKTFSTPFGLKEKNTAYFWGRRKHCSR